MPETYVGGPDGRKRVTGIWVGTDAGRREIDKVWVGTASGNQLVYSKAPLFTAVIDLTATPASSSSITLTWAVTAPAGAVYTLYRTGGPSSTGALPNGATALSYTDTGLAASSTYSYRVDMVLNGAVIASDSASAATQAAPAPTYQQKTATLSASGAGSYSGSGAKRTDTSSFYSGYYSGTWGVQRSAFVFAVPADLRNCVSVDRVRISVKNAHSYSGSGVTQHLAVTHTPTLGSSWPGSTGSFGGRATAKGGWYGGAEWVDITNDREPNFNDTVANNFRLRGACGICLVPPNGSTAYYSYWGSMRIEFVYTIRTG